METLSLNEIINVYEKENWEIITLDTIDQYKSRVKPTLSESFGGNKITFNRNGKFYKIIVNEELGEYLLYAFSIKDISSLLDRKKDEEIFESLKNIKLNNSSLYSSIEEIKKSVVLAREILNNCNYIVCRLFSIQKDVVVSTVGYVFIQDVNSTVPIDSIACKTDNNEIILVCSDEFVQLFEDEDNANYVKGLILSSISFILEEYK